MVSRLDLQGRHPSFEVIVLAVEARTLEERRCSLPSRQELGAVGLEAEQVNCPVCGGTPVRQRHSWLFRCPGCGLLSSTLQPKIPTATERSNIDETVRRRGLGSTRSRNNSLILDKLEVVLAGSKKSVLDVGCGHGYFLSDAMLRGFSVVGIEPDANVAPETSARTGSCVRQGFFPDVLTASEKFDAIVFNDVIEHIPDVSAAIRACERHLSDRGILVLNAPDQRGVFYRLSSLLDRFGISGPLKRLWQVGLPSPHMWYFKPNHLVTLGQNAGLSLSDKFAMVPISRDGLAARIFYVEDQSRVLSYIAYAFALIILPFLEALPPDLGVVFLSKKSTPEIDAA